jgi:1-deoxy-D-xylulose-5-phosphate reductoisomerase
MTRGHVDDSFEPGSRNRPRRRRLIVLGSTGSIGVNCLAVVAHLRDTNSCHFNVAGLAAGSNVPLLLEQARQFAVEHIAIADGAGQRVDSTAAKVFTGSDSALQLVEHVARSGDLVVGAMVGSAGIPAILAAIERGCDIALANKETLVAAGALVMPLARERNVNVLPIDSEHSAILQCLEGHIETSKRRNVKMKDEMGDGDFAVSTFRRFDVSGLRRIVITASGGPFRGWSRDRMERATVKDALNHPTWSMGPKVTIDSASLMNKALEIIEAHWLFGLPADKIEVIVHPQSLIHSFVEFVDGSVIAQLGPPDMRTPIQYALTWPERASGISRAMDWTNLKRMDFEPVDLDHFEAPLLAKRVIEAGGTSGAILNAANEAAVTAFLNHQIAFPRITELVREALDALPPTPVRNLNDVMQADEAAREFVNDRLDPGNPRNPRVQAVRSAGLAAAKTEP